MAAAHMSPIQSVPVELSVVLGTADVPIGQLLRMGRGATIPLDVGFDDPSLVYANDQPVARGRVHVEDDRLFIMITEGVVKGQR